MPIHSIMAGLAAAAAVAMPQPQTGYPGTPDAAISRAPLPAFPYLHWPAAFEPKGAPVDQPVGHFRFWDGKTLQDVEGRTLLVTLVARRGPFDAAALRGTIERQLTRLGAARIASGPVPATLLDTINDGDKQALAPGLGDLAHDPARTWVIRRANRQMVWVQYTDNDRQASLAIVATRPR